MVDKSEKFNWLVRVGYFSRAVLYIALGAVALTSAGAISQGTDGVFQAIEDIPAGTFVLWIMVVGLVAYALFRFASTAFDVENNGNDAKGWGKRIGHAGSGVGHLALAYSAYKLASRPPVSEGSGGGAQEVAAGVLSADLGGVVLGLLGIAFFAAAIAQAKKGVTASFMNRISARAPSATKILGQIGFLSRGVVYAVIGWSLVQSGFFGQGSENVKTLAEALGSLADMGVVFTIVAAGLLIFGLFSLVLARYRIIPELDGDMGVPKFRA